MIRRLLGDPRKLGIKGVATDLTQADVRGLGLGSGFVDYKIAALDPTWSGLCFARRSGRKPPAR